MLMSLKNLQIKYSYDSDVDEILDSFYIPALSASVKYQRLAGFFSSSSLSAAARGIIGLISNNGKMELVCSAKLKKEDVEAVTEASKRPEDVIEECTLEEMANIEDLQNEFVINHVKALGWMVARKLLEIKVALVKDINKKPLDYIEVMDTGIFHQKVGILTDADGNKISFSGCVNESEYAWRRNIEEFKVFCSWEKSERRYLQADCDKFSKFWEGLARRTEVFNIPEAVKNKLIDIAPDNIESFGSKHFRPSRKEIKLFEHQKEAINKWSKNNKMCIFEMATGTGKTFSALGCLKHLILEGEKLVTIIACPYNHLISQWKSSLVEFGISEECIIADSSNPRWKKELIDSISDINNNNYKFLVVLTTHDTFYKQDFIDRVEMVNNKLFLIGDEVHGMWSEERKKGFIDHYCYRLGLSATPSRWFDPEGTDELFKYFNIKNEDDKYSFSLHDALTTINPDTGKTYLVPYEYKPSIIMLTEEEFEKYEEETKSIVRYYYKTKNRKDQKKSFALICKKRQDIIRNASNKYIAFEDILDALDEIQHCLIYCSPDQIEKVQNILIERHILQHKITQKESTRPEREYDGISERDYLLNNFAKGSYQALVAMRCLDEGIDIPPARIGIILASTDNPREYIQRRGRILRQYPGKEVAVIYDMIVLPPSGGEISDNLVKLEQKIVEKELKRCEEFANDSNNYLECLEIMENIKNYFNQDA